MPKTPYSLAQNATALAALVALLIGCNATNSTPTGPALSTPNTPVASSPIRFEYALSLKLSPSQTRTDVEAQTGGTILDWRPQAGYAIVGLHTPPAASAGQSAPNMNAIQAPEGISASGWSSWANGWSSWANGWSSWANGYTGAPTTFPENAAAWTLIKLDAGWLRAPHFGAGVTVAVIDTGIDENHPAFAGHLAPLADQKDFVDGGTPQDEGQAGQHGYGHGTAVAGIILQVAPQAIILPIRVLDADGRGDTDRVAMAIGWAVDHGAKLINLSLGSQSYAQPIQDALQFAKSAGVIVVAATGNTGDQAITFPASDARNSDQLISVSSVNASGQLSSFATYGAQLEIYAPGERILTPAPGAAKALWSGTSMAAPIATGALALAYGEPLRDPLNPPQQLSNFANQIEFSQLNPSAPAASRTSMGILDVDQFLLHVVQ